MSWPSETVPTAVFDTSPLVFLDTLGYADLLPKLFRVVVTSQVAVELRRKRSAPGSGLPDRPWVDVQTPEAGTLERVVRELGAGAGENASIALAGERGATVVLDDLKARRYARSEGLRVVGTLGLLVLIHRSGKAARAPEEEFAVLGAHGMWLSERIKAPVLQELAATPGEEGLEKLQGAAGGC